MPAINRCAWGAGLEGEVEGMEQKVALCKAEHEAAKASLAEQKARLKECDKGISACAQRKESLSRQASELALDRKKMEHE